MGHFLFISVFGLEDCDIFLFIFIFVGGKSAEVIFFSYANVDQILSLSQ